MAGNLLPSAVKLALDGTRWFRLGMSAGVALGAWAVVVSVHRWLAESERSLAGTVVLGAVVTFVALAVQGLRGSFSQRRPDRTHEPVVLAQASLAGAAALPLTAAQVGVPLSTAELSWAPVMFILGLLVRGSDGAVDGAHRLPAQRVVVIGVGPEAVELVDLMEQHPDVGVEVLGVIGDRQVADRHGLSRRWLGPTEHMVEVLESIGAESVIITSTGFRGHSFRAVTSTLLQHGYVVRISPGVSRWNATRLEVEHFVHEPWLAVRPSRVGRAAGLTKRGIDVVGSVVLLLCLAPVMAVSALAVKLEDGGPVFFRQRRVGRDGREFPMTKFRSMHLDAEARLGELRADNERTGPLFKLQRDPRVTRVGHVLRETSIDELPQLFDVLRGDMSLVGPRPPLPSERADFGPEMELRFAVRPGITGLWQVEARDNASFEAYCRLDLHYVENHSLSLDVRIMLATFDQLLNRAARLPFSYLAQRRRTQASGSTGPLPAETMTLAVPLTPVGVAISIEMPREPADGDASPMGPALDRVAAGKIPEGTEPIQLTELVVEIADEDAAGATLPR